MTNTIKKTKSMKIIKLTVLLLFLCGCNGNPSKEARIQSLETEVQLLKNEIIYLKQRVELLTIEVQKQNVKDQSMKEK